MQSPTTPRPKPAPAKKPSQYDNGETNWHASTGSFADWVRAEKPTRFVADLRKEPDELPYYEPDVI